MFGLDVIIYNSKFWFLVLNRGLRGWFPDQPLGEILRIANGERGKQTKCEFNYWNLAC